MPRGGSTLLSSRDICATWTGVLCGPRRHVVLPSGDPPTPKSVRGGSVLRGLWRPYYRQQKQAAIPEVSSL